MTQIVFNNVTKQFSTTVKALDNVTFSIEPGEFVFLVGPSGAGKSTLIKMLIREDMPTAGSIIFNDENILEYTHKELPALRRRIGVVFQDFKVLRSKTVFENVAVALDVAGVPMYEIENVVPNVLNLVGLLDKIHRMPHQLSGGELQRLAIARALAHEPDVIVADEPTGNIDPKASEDILSIFKQINELGTTILMSTHDKELVDSLKKRVLKLENGILVSDKKGAKYD
ncbi:MAG: cell division ATP-binding protein FtsE [Patescibacteria group bacterium]